MTIELTASSLIAASTPLFKPSLTLAESALTGGELSVITATESVTSRLVTSLMVEIIFPLNYLIKQYASLNED